LNRSTASKEISTESRNWFATCNC